MILIPVGHTHRYDSPSMTFISIYTYIINIYWYAPGAAYGLTGLPQAVFVLRGGEQDMILLETTSLLYNV